MTINRPQAIRVWSCPMQIKWWVKLRPVRMQAMAEPEDSAPPEADEGADAELDAAPEPVPQPEYGGPLNDDE